MSAGKGVRSFATMNRKTIATAAVAATVATAFGGLSAAGGASSDTLVLGVSFDARSVVVHKARPGAKGHRPGDLFAISATLTRDGAKYGRIEGAQVAVDGQYEGVSQHLTFLLPDGAVETLGAGTNKRVPGLPAPSDADPVAIVGGTGGYAGRTGEAILGDDTVTLRFAD